VPPLISFPLPKIAKKAPGFRHVEMSTALYLFLHIYCSMTEFYGKALQPWFALLSMQFHHVHCYSILMVFQEWIMLI